MPYGIIKVDTITFTDGGADKTVSISGLVQNPTFSGNITVTGTVSGNVIQGGTTVSGATVTGTAGQFGTLTGNTAGFTTITGATVTGTVAQFTTITGGTAGFTTVTGATVTGTTANFTTLSGTTVTGNTGSFTTVTGGVATITSGVFAVGAEALPSISFASDPNTGIYSPGADQVAISTGGSGRLFVDASGNIGINTSPSSLGSSVTTLEIKGGSTTRSGGLRVSSSDSSVKGAFYIYDGAGVLGTESATPLDIYTGNSPRLRITSGGLVGVGTTNPLVKFVASNGGAEGIELAPAYSAGNNFTFHINRSGSAYVTNSQVASAHIFRISSDSTEAVRIDSAGRVGIGTSSPSSSLTVKADSNTYGLTVNGRTADGISTTAFYANDGTTIYGWLQARAEYFQIAGQNTSGGIFLDTSNRVGIGTTSPSQALSVAGNISSSAVGTNYVASSSQGVTTSYLITDTSGANIQVDGAWPIRFTTNSGERARIDSSGRLLVGTSTEVSSVSPSIQTVRAGAGFIAIANSNTVGAAATTLGQIGFYGYQGSYALSATITADADATWSTDDYPSRLSFSTTADGASSPTPRFIINSAGSHYPATDNSFLLGTAAFRWSAVYAVNGTIQTSDAREKTEVTDAVLGSDFIKSLRPVSYKWLVGHNDVESTDDGEVRTPKPGVRTHWGFIAQEVKQAVDVAGVDFGGWVLTDKGDSDSQQGLRYDQFIAPLTKALQEALAEIDVLKAKVAALESA